MKIDFPNDWKILKIGNLHNKDGNIVQTGPFGAQLHSADYVKKGVPFILIRNFKNNRINTSDMPFITEKDAERLKRYRLKEGDIIFSRVGRIGDTVYVENFMDGWTISGQLLRIRSNDERIYNRFLNYIIKSDYVQRQIHANYVGSTRKSLNSTILEQLKFPQPLINEQKKIVSILSNIQNIISYTQRIIDKLHRLKKGLMQRLFTEGIGHTEFKETRLGKIPEEWDVVRFNDLALKFLGGGTPSTKTSKYWDGGIPWMTSAILDKMYINDGMRYITEEGLKKSASNLIPKGSLLISTRVGIGKVGIAGIDVAISQDLTGVVIDLEKSLTEFLYWFFLNSQNKLNNISQGTTVKGIERKFLKILKIPLPPLPEQENITKILNNLNNKIINQRNYQSKLKKIKKSLMQNLLTGKKRVKIN